MVIDYDTERFDFRGWACSALGIEQLHRLHETAEPSELFSADDFRQSLRSRLSEKFSDCRALFEEFVSTVVEPEFGGLVSYQCPPIMRVHLHGFGTISPFHRDRDFNSDAERDIVCRNRNVWLPLTKVWENNSIWIESGEGESFDPVELEYGQALIFDGLNLMHGSVRNDTGATRVSMDFRVLPPRGYQAER